MLTPEQRAKLKSAGYSDTKINVFEARKAIKEKETQQEPGYLDRIKQDFQTRQAEVVNINKSSASLPEKILQNVGQVAGGAFDLVSEAPIIKQGLDIAGKGIKSLSETAPIKFAGDIVSPVTQKAVDTYKSLPTNIQKDLEAVVNIASIIPVGAGAKGSIIAGEKALQATKAGAKTLKTAVGTTKKVAGEIIPTADRVVNFQVSKALDLTAGDIKNINLSTGNEVGQFLADKNLIRGNKIETTKALQDFFDANYKTVREEIGKVTKTYNVSSVPRYTDALQQIKKVIGDTPGLEKASVEVENLLNNATKGGKVSLNDVQKVKELLDEHFSLYKVTGDIKEGATKKGLTNMRKELKGFIEKEVKTNTGTDIAKLNNEVSTAKSTLNAIEVRSTRGLTASNLKIGDLATFGVGSMFGGPLVGVAAVVGKKIMGTSAFRLKFAKILDTWSDAKKLRVRQELLKGNVPEEVSKVINQFSESKNQNIIKNTRAKNSISNTISQSKPKVKPPITPPTNLINEARKYKSAEEFVKSITFRGEPTGSKVAGKPYGSLIRETKTGLPKTAMGVGGIPVSKDFITARGFGSEIRAYIPKENTKILSNPTEIMKIANVKSAHDFYFKAGKVPPVDSVNFYEKAKLAGYDAVDLSAVEKLHRELPGDTVFLKDAEQEMRIINKNAFTEIKNPPKTKSQLTDIWRKANKGKDIISSQSSKAEPSILKVQPTTKINSNTPKNVISTTIPKTKPKVK